MANTEIYASVQIENAVERKWFNISSQTLNEVTDEQKKEIDARLVVSLRKVLESLDNKNWALDEKPDGTTWADFYDSATYDEYNSKI